MLAFEFQNVHYEAFICGVYFNNLRGQIRKMDRPWLSVIVPVYNAQKFLNKCLSSIKIQTYKNFEVILVDDGSTDKSSEICNKYALQDYRFHHIRKENGGAFQTRIYGAKMAKGIYIMFCDADDFYIRKDAFKILYDELKNEQYDALQFAYISKYNHIRRKKVSVKSEISIEKEKFLIEEYPILLCNYWEKSHLTMNVWNKVYHRRLLGNLIGYDPAEKIFWGEDQILNIQLLSTCNSFRFVPYCLYCYQELTGGTNLFSANTMKDLDAIKKYQLEYLNSYQGRLKRKIKKRLFSEVAGWFFVYIQQATKYINDSELKKLINESLKLPRIQDAREYYISENNENWEAASLLRKADVDEYIIKAKRISKKKELRTIVKEVIKKI